MFLPSFALRMKSIDHFLKYRDLLQIIPHLGVRPPGFNLCFLVRGSVSCVALYIQFASIYVSAGEKITHRLRSRLQIIRIHRRPVLFLCLPLKNRGNEISPVLFIDKCIIFVLILTAAAFPKLMPIDNTH